jgi:hypothetical protein
MKINDILEIENQNQMVFSFSKKEYFGVVTRFLHGIL